MQNDEKSKEECNSIVYCKTCNNIIDEKYKKENNELEKCNNELFKLTNDHEIIKTIHDQKKKEENQLELEIDKLCQENKELADENEKLFNEYNTIRYKLQKLKYFILKKKQLKPNEIEENNHNPNTKLSEQFLINYQMLNLKKQRNDTHSYTVYPNFCPHSTFNFVTIYTCCNKAYPCQICHNRKEFHLPEKSEQKYYCTSCFGITHCMRCDTCGVSFYRKNKKRIIRKKMVKNT